MKLFGLNIERAKPRAKATLGQIARATNLGNPLWGEGAEWAPEKYAEYYATSVPAYRAIKLRADAVATAPLVVSRVLPNGEMEIVGSADPIQGLLDRVNGWWTQSDLFKATETNLCIWGSAYWFVEKQGGMAIGLWPLRPDRMRVVPDRSGNASAYIVGFIYQAPGGQRIALTRDELVWFRYYNPMDEFAGLSPLAAARLSLNMGRNAVRFNAAFFENGALPQDIIYPVQGPVTDEEIEDFYRRLEKRHKSPRNAHRPMVVDLSQSGKPERLGLAQRDMEFLATLNYTVEDAARVWGVPPPKMYSQQQATYNNVKQADIEFYSDTIASEWAFLEGEINEMLVPLLGVQDIRVSFDTSGVLPLQEALAELHTREREDVKAGILTINEVRQRRNLQPVPWGDEKPATPVPFSGSSFPALSVESNGHRSWPVTKAVNRGDSVVADFAKSLDSEQRPLLANVRSLFDSQRADVLRRLHGEKALTKQWNNLFDINEWNMIFKGLNIPIIMDILAHAAWRQARQFGLGPFDSGRASVRDWVDKRVMFWSDQINIETGKLLMAELEEGAQLGESIPQLSQRVEKVFAFNNSVRAERIARTETIAASNAGHIEAYKQSELVEGKEWVAAMDERTRETHAEAHGQVVSKEGTFLVGGEYLVAPGMGGSAGNVINCRCITVPILRQRVLSASEMEKTKTIKRSIERDGNGFIIAVTEESNGDR